MGNHRTSPKLERGRRYYTCSYCKRELHVNELPTMDGKSLAACELAGHLECLDCERERFERERAARLAVVCDQCGAAAGEDCRGELARALPEGTVHCAGGNRELAVYALYPEEEGEGA